MRVALVVHEFPKASESFIVDHFLDLLDRGLDVHLVAEREGTAWPRFPELARARERIHAWPAAGLRRPLAAFAWLLRALATRPLATLRCAAAELRAGPRGAAGRFAFALPLVGLRPDVVHLEFGSLGLHRSELKQALGCALAVSFRGWDICYYALEQPAAYDALFRVADRVHFLGEDLRQRARRRGLPDRLAYDLIPPAVDARSFRPQPRERSQASSPLRVLSVGRLHWKKGYEFALAALRQLVDAGREVEYRIVGAGDFEDAVRACIRDLRLEDRVRLLGETDRDSVRQQLQWADVFLHAAVSEGFCNAVLEAQAMELPVVCSDADGLPENVADGVTGIVVPRRDPHALAAALAALARDPERRRRMGAAGRQRVREHFAREAQVGAFADFYGRALEVSSRSRRRGLCEKRRIT